MNQRKKATIRDVAEAAGVSIATVSKYINRQQSFSPSVEEKLRSAILDLGYSQNPAARSMVTGRTTAIGLAVMDISNPHYANVMKGANRVALANGYNLLVVDLEEKSTGVRELLEPLVLRTDGLIVSARIPKDVVDWLAELDKPVAFLGQPERQGVVSVGMDSVEVASLLAGYLAQQGFTRIGYVGYPRAAWNVERLRGLHAVLDPAGIELMEFNAEEPTSEAGERVAAKVLLRSDRPQAVIGCNDLVAIGLMTQARALGFRIPEDVAFAGIDNIPTSRYVTPALTTVDVFSEATGEAVMKQIISMVTDQPPSDELRRQPLLIVRDSAKRVSGDDIPAKAEELSKSEELGK
ncbi:LacI family DNA-binding transcriptional regulator [Roseibium salinum]|uniref:LacI family DNA-binding transcriptional regulator n=1 Tax=Roseibium salinum TaxID=1604349 RepID=A0ABT3QVM3_9HYPH|nr:LacI family DNA-binding transcriptional regulator [Roseibium sp. DSM 29163]MCX2720969.1 LacI family DNA-binding transcriptional regulator [Roseibium sp. DSM 29163]